MRIKVPKWSKRYLVCYRWKEWLGNSKLNSFSENSIWRLILISSWWHSYNFIDIWRLIDMCPLPLCCSNDSQKCERKIINPKKNTEKIKKGKNFSLKARYWSLEFSQKHNIHNFCYLPNFCYNFFVTLQTLNDARRTFFKHWLIISNFELLTVVFRSWE